MLKSSTVMAKLSARHPEDFILCAPFAETPAKRLGFGLYAFVTGFKLDEEKQSREVCDKKLTREAAAGCYDNGDGDEEDSVAWEEVHKDCIEKERDRKLVPGTLDQEMDWAVFNKGGEGVKSTDQAMSKSSTVMAKLMSAGHPEDFILCAPFAKTPADLLGFELYALVMGFKLDKEEQSQAEVLITCTAEVASFYDNGDGVEEDSVA
ncbi:hypothetical protein RHSIM_Rhsim13G0154900 [Rhododendron simsii]|uniref:Uncharacterized protein n=1 Tax=Rhododendron simsii TaxID=118357 RepID=A0A834FXS6_RHOSS|nr:hypothetical protein RHSIM_Rhsim13G0154900 [Rhododendron simsii]